MKTDFSLALRQMLSGAKVKRLDWDDMPDYIHIQTKEGKKYIYENKVERWWFPTQKDILAVDWVEVKDPGPNKENLTSI